MTTPTDQLTPDTLEKYFRSGTATNHHVSDSPEVMIVIDGSSQKISVLTPRHGPALDTAPLRRVTTGVEVRNGAEWSRLTLDARGMHAEAYGLVISVVQAMRGGASFAAASSAAMTNMKALLAARPRISEERQIGMVGELLLFRALIDAFDEHAAVDWWLGPLAEEHDYAFPAFDAEVKTTLGESRTHVIHGAGQLEPNPGRALWLVSVQITRSGGDPQGVTLPVLIDEVRQRLTTTRHRFDERLTSQGWEDDDAGMYPDSYVLRSEPAAYLVDTDFPAVTWERLKAAVPHSDLVSDVSYRVNLSGRAPGTPGTPLDAFVPAPTGSQEG